MSFARAVLSLVLCLSGSSPPYVVRTSPRTVEVIPSQGWHVNEDYPWRIVTSDNKDRKFTLKPGLARATGLTAGPAVIRGGVCNATSCVGISKIVVVPQ